MSSAHDLAKEPSLTKDPDAGSFGADESAASDALAAAAAEDRGQTTIADRVVEKVAARAAMEIDRAVGVPRRVLGQTIGSVGPDSKPRASAKVDGSIVSVTVSISVEYPEPVREVAANVRNQVMTRVGQFCGLEVVEVHVDVPHFYSPQQTQPTRRVQ